MRIEEVIKALKAEPSFQKIGKTALRNHPFYQSALRLDFQRCDCSCADDADGWHEYIAAGQNGRPWVVALRLAHGVITISQRERHTCKPPRAPNALDYSSRF